MRYSTLQHRLQRNVYESEDKSEKDEYMCGSESATGDCYISICPPIFLPRPAATHSSSSSLTRLTNTYQPFKTASKDEDRSARFQRRQQHSLAKLTLGR